MKGFLRFAALLSVAVALCSAAVPRLTSVEPGAATPGDEIVASGVNLDSKTVTKLFLTAGGKDIQVKMQDQTAETIRFVVPKEAEIGTYYNLMLQTGGAAPALLEQPLGCHIDDAEGVKRRAEEEAAFAEDPVVEEPAQEEPAESQN